MNHEIAPLSIIIANSDSKEVAQAKGILEEQGYYISCAKTHEDLLECYKCSPPDIVMLDENFDSVGSGKAFEFFESEKIKRFLPVVIISDISNHEKLEKDMKFGDLIIIKPFSESMLRAKIKSIKQIINTNTELDEKKKQLEYFKTTEETEKIIAKKIFDRIAHTGCLDQPCIRHLIKPMCAFNGDVLLAAKKPSGDLHLMLGDFTGHGLPAAVGALPLADTFYVMTDKGFSITDILLELNSKLKSILPTSFFCAAIFISINTKEGILEAWNGGVPSGIIYNPKDDTVRSIPSTTTPLGILENHEIDTQLRAYSIEPGEKIFMFSDGVIESQNVDKELFGEERLYSLISSENGDVFEKIKEDLQRFRGQTAQNDDITLVEYTYHGILNEIDSLTNGADSSAKTSLDCHMSFELRTETLRNIDPLPLLLNMFTGYKGLYKHIGRIYNILSELYSNALDYGVLKLDPVLRRELDLAQYYLERKQALDNLQYGYVKFDIEHIPGFNGIGGQMIINIEDSGNGFDYRQKTYTEESATPTHGIALVKYLADAVYYQGKGNRVCAIYSWEG